MESKKKIIFRVGRVLEVIVFVFFFFVINEAHIFPFQLENNKLHLCILHSGHATSSKKKKQKVIFKFDRDTKKSILIEYPIG